MPDAKPFAVALLVALASLEGGTALAQPAGPPSRVEARSVWLSEGRTASLLITWAALEEDCSARLVIAGSAPATIHDGVVAGTLVVGHGLLLLAYGIDDARAPFRVWSTAADGSGELGAPVSIERPTARPGAPFAVAATATPDGFAVLFQEVLADDPTAAQTFLVRLDQRGAPRGPAREVPVPWSLADMAWNGQGFHLALIYPGNGSGGGMRLSMVGFTEDFRQLQHPDWASGAGVIGDVHLLAADGRVRAFYRGGPRGDRLLESDVTTIRGWGAEPPAARDLGPLGPDRAVLLSGAEGQTRATSLEVTPR